MEMEIVFSGGDRVDAHLGDMVIPTDQDRTEPAPFVLFLASLGTCAGIYVLNFCRARELDTEGIRLVQRTHTNRDTRMVERIDLDIEVPADFPEKYHKALIRAAGQCAVKKHLAEPPQIEVRTVVAEPAGG
jgi:ribosomal protein S12 methylthiotransferase accessory factor